MMRKIKNRILNHEIFKLFKLKEYSLILCCYGNKPTEILSIILRHHSWLKVIDCVLCGDIIILISDIKFNVVLNAEFLKLQLYYNAIV